LFGGQSLVRACQCAPQGCWEGWPCLSRSVTSPSRICWSASRGKAQAQVGVTEFSAPALKTQAGALPSPLQHSGCTTPRPRGEKRFAQIYKIDECVFEEIRQPLSRARALLLWYNFTKIHKAHKLTPAITDRLWTVEDIVALVEAAEPKPWQGGPYK
jgi:hypothetical protein